VSYQPRVQADKAEHIQPHLDPLKDIFNFTIESQVLYHAPLAFEPSRGHSSGFTKGSEDQKRLDEALDEASQGQVEAEEVAKALIEEEKGQDGWQVDEEMMKVFVNTEDWSLGES
jgi:phosphatidylinositol glycan class S